MLEDFSGGHRAPVKLGRLLSSYRCISGYIIRQKTYPNNPCTIRLSHYFRPCAKSDNTPSPVKVAAAGCVAVALVLPAPVLAYERYVVQAAERQPAIFQRMRSSSLSPGSMASESALSLSKMISVPWSTLSSSQLIRCSSVCRAVNTWHVGISVLKSS